MARFAAATALFLALAAEVSSDEVVLTDGGTLRCEVVRVTADHVEVRLPHGSMVLRREKVAEIRRETREQYLRKEADASLKAGSPASAVEMYEAILAADPADEGARAGLVEALLRHADDLARSFRFGEARWALSRLRALDPRHRAAAVLATRIAAEERANEEMEALGRLALTHGDAAAALVLFDRLRLRKPAADPGVEEALATAHAMAARGALEAGDMRRALDHCRSAAAHGSRDIEKTLFLLQPVAVLEALKEGHADEARRLLERIDDRYPDPAVPAFLKGVLHHVTGEVEESLRWYAEAARRAEGAEPPRAGMAYGAVKAYAAATLRAAVARPPAEGVRRWRETFLRELDRHEARHFVVFAAGERRAEELGEAADATFDRIARDLLGEVPAGRVELVVHPAREAYLAADPAPRGTPLAEVTLPRDKTSGVCYVTLDERGGTLVRVETWEQPGLEADTLPHEIVHAVQRAGLPVFRRGHWLDEGLATLYESPAGQGSRAALWRQLREGRIPLPELLALRSTPPDRAPLFFAEAHALASFLRDLGDDAAWRLFVPRYAATGVEWAVRGAYGVPSLAELERRFMSQ